MQKSKAVRYVFSGSNRHLIESMFNDRNRPFYNSCDKIALKRIGAEHYVPYIGKAAKARWGAMLGETVIEEILEFTRCHSYYVNKLCSLLWREDQVPSTDIINKLWAQYIEDNRTRVEQELSLLALNQRKILLHLANGHDVKTPFSKEYALLWEMSTTSIHRSMGALITKDYVVVDDEMNYRVLDPLIEAVLQDNTSG